jgi:hypothetical protein
VPGQETGLAIRGKRRAQSVGRRGDAVPGTAQHRDAELQPGQTRTSESTAAVYRREVEYHGLETQHHGRKLRVHHVRSDSKTHPILDQASRPPLRRRNGVHAS